MRKTMIFVVVLTAFAFASASHAQHVKVFDGSSGVVLAPNSSTSATILAGRTMRLRIAAVNNGAGNRDINDIYIFQSPTTQIRHRQSACDETAPALRTAGARTQKLKWSYYPASREYVLPVETDRAWRETCRIFSLRDSRGTEYRAEIRFK
jgi:hypothetical protein